MSKSKEVKEVKPNKVKAKVSETVSTTARVVKNGVRMLVTFSLLYICVLTFVSLKTMTNDVQYISAAFALSVVAVFSLELLVRFLAKDK